MARRTPSQQASASGNDPLKDSGIRMPRHFRTTESYRFLINETLKALAHKKIGREQAYAIRDAAMSGAELLLSYGAQKRTDGGVVVVAEEDQVQVSEEAPPPEIELEATSVEIDGNDTTERGTKSPQSNVPAKIIALLRLQRPANDVKRQPGHEEDGD